MSFLDGSDINNTAVLAPEAPTEPIAAPASAPAPQAEIRDSYMKKSNFSENRMFSTAIKDASSEESRHFRRLGSSKSELVPNEGYRSRRNRSKSPDAMQIDREEQERPRRIIKRRSAIEEKNPTRVVSRADGTIKIQVKDARELIGPTSAPKSRSPERGRSRQGRYNRGPMEVEPMPVMDAPPFTELPLIMERPLKQKCAYFPECKNKECPYYHPTRICVHFPNCSRGSECTYIHPQIPCKYQDACQNPVCNYYHSPALSKAMNPIPVQSTVVCKFYPNCANPSCPFIHPVEIPCKFGISCQRPGCHFKHPEGHAIVPKTKVFSPCIFGKACAKPGCFYQHPPPDAPNDQMAIEQQTINDNTQEQQTLPHIDNYNELGNVMPAQ